MKGGKDDDGPPTEAASAASAVPAANEEHKKSQTAKDVLQTTDRKKARMPKTFKNMKMKKSYRHKCRSGGDDDDDKFETYSTKIVEQVHFFGVAQSQSNYV